MLYFCLNWISRILKKKKKNLSLQVWQKIFIDDVWYLNDILEISKILLFPRFTDVELANLYIKSAKWLFDIHKQHKMIITIRIRLTSFTSYSYLSVYVCVCVYLCMHMYVVTPKRNSFSKFQRSFLKWFLSLIAWLCAWQAVCCMKNNY